MPEALSQSHQQHDSCGESDALCCGAWERPCGPRGSRLGSCGAGGVDGGCWMVKEGWFFNHSTLVLVLFHRI